jgi:hypothetical protein
MPEPVTRLSAALEGRYRIERELGEGGMATVYLAEDLKHDRKVAVKVLRPELAAVIGGERFISEIKTTAALQHPHILPLFDSGEADGFLYYVMPYVEGESLRARLDRERQLDVDEAVHITKAVASALQYAHERDIIHRDIKPENVLLHAGEPVVSDFGIALAISAAGGGRLTETGLSLGTPHYISPEQAAADRDLTARSDIYSLACMLYEMLAGQPPHTGPTAQSILVRILTEDPRPVSDVRPTVPPHVWATLSKGLEKLPADRFKSADELRAALDDTSFRYLRAKKGPVAEAIPDGPARARRPWATVHAAVTAVLALSTAWLAFGERGTGASAPDAPLVSFVALDSAVGTSWVDVGPDGTVAYVRDNRLSVRPPGALEAQQLADVEAMHFDVSPDGRWIVFLEPAGTPTRLRKVPVGGGPIANVFSGGGRLVLLPTWGDDGWIYFASGEGFPNQLHRVPDVGGPAELLLETPGTLLFPSATLPGGRALVYTAADSSVSAGRLMLLYLESRDTTELVAEGFQARWSPTGHLVYAHYSGALWAVPFDPGRLQVSGQPVPVLEGLGTNLSFASYGLSPTGTLAFVSGSGGEGGISGWTFALVDEQGNREALPIEPTDHTDLRISPDGGSAAYTRQGDIWIFDLDRGTNVPLSEGRTGQHNPVWSPDGTRVAYHSNGDVRVRVADRSAEPEQVTSTVQVDNPEEWLEDGTIIVSTQAGERDLFAVSVEGDSRPRPLLEADWDEGRARISPDGRWLAYFSGRSGTAQLYVRSWPGLESETMISAGDADLGDIGYPQWSPDGRTLYYSRDAELVAAELRATDRFEVVDRRTLPFRVNGFLQDIHPDGRLLVAELAGASTAEGGMAPQLIVVTNWFTELRARLGGG